MPGSRLERWSLFFPLELLLLGLLLVVGCPCYCCYCYGGYNFVEVDCSLFVGYKLVYMLEYMLEYTRPRRNEG